MKLSFIQILLIISILLGMGIVVYRVQQTTPEETMEPVSLEPITEVKKNEPPTNSTADVITKPEPTPQPAEKKEPAIAKVATPPPPEIKIQEPPKADENVQAENRSRERLYQQFNQLLDRLDQETDPTRRLSLIRQLAGYIRVDTLNVLDWAMALEDPEERRVALAAINEKALVGIGARIETDETGLPLIRETTALSAVGASGLVEPGDYIVGMINEYGETIYFQDMPVEQAAQNLRGPAGTQIFLLMKRANGGTFTVPIERSLIIMQ